MASQDLVKSEQEQLGAMTTRELIAYRDVLRAPAIKAGDVQKMGRHEKIVDDLLAQRDPEPPERFVLMDGVQDRIDQCLRAISEAATSDSALATKLHDSLDHCFRTLERLAHSDPSPRLMTDFAPLSFTFRAGGFFGGLIFHGAHDGGGSGGPPTLSVCLEPTVGWQIHT